MNPNDDSMGGWGTRETLIRPEQFAIQVRQDLTPVKHRPSVLFVALFVALIMSGIIGFCVAAAVLGF